MNEHTPGPWTLDKKSAISYGWRDGKPIRYEIAECKGFPASAEANARLIAAAPELLEALVGCAEMLEDCAKQHWLDGSGYCHGTLAEKHASLARAAIAKATGGERE
jgi:hypothetical protein